MAFKVSPWLSVTLSWNHDARAEKNNWRSFNTTSWIQLQWMKKWGPPQRLSGLPSNKKPGTDRTRRGPRSGSSPTEIFFYHSVAGSMKWMQCYGISKFNRVKCVFWKKKKKNQEWEIEFEEHSTCMRWAHLRSLETFLWCKGFLNKGFHWPVGSRHAHTDILLLAIP